MNMTRSHRKMAHFMRVARLKKKPTRSSRVMLERKLITRISEHGKEDVQYKAWSSHRMRKMK